MNEEAQTKGRMAANENLAFLKVLSKEVVVSYSDW